MSPVNMDHDLLIKISTDVGYIVKSLEESKTAITFLKSENQLRKDWQETADTKIKVYTGVAAFIGGIIVWIANVIIGIIEKRA